MSTAQDEHLIVGRVLIRSMLKSSAGLEERYRGRLCQGFSERGVHVQRVFVRTGPGW